MAKNEPKSIEHLTYEEAYAELEAIVASLESGEQTLDQSLALFERGQVLAKHCAALLDRADLKIRKLVDETLVEVAETE
jgi:exodeoxyribonuclease VII small subunit